MINQFCGGMLNRFRLANSHSRSIFITSRFLIDQRWRERNGLPKNPNAYGPLTNGPDYTYLDGRPTPIGSRLKNRILKQREIAEKIIKFSKEIDFAVQRYDHMQMEKENTRKKTLASKLKPKGLPFQRNDPAKK